MSESEERSGPGLNRALGLFAITAFGVGDILGSGVYVLIGKVAAISGTAAWLSFTLAGITAALTGLTYAELTSRYPRAGGAAHFCNVAYRNSLVTFLVIIFVVASGLFSMAATGRAFADYAFKYFEISTLFDDYIIPIAFALLVCYVAVRGVVFSSGANIFCMIVECIGLLIIIVLGMKYLGTVDYMEIPKNEDLSTAAVLITGAAMCFFAFVGFEDMANMAEEVKNPERNLPIAIILAIIITGTIYGLISLIAVSVVPISVLGASSTPLMDVVSASSPGFPTWIYSIIPGIAVFNTALLNLMMASRLIYGMSRGENNLLPRGLSVLHPRHRTPLGGVVIGFLVVTTMLILFSDLSMLTSGTSTCLLIVFMLLHIGLLLIKRRPDAPKPVISIPAIVPILGALSCVGLLYRSNTTALISAGALAVAGLILYGVNAIFRGRSEVEVPD